MKRQLAAITILLLLLPVNGRSQQQPTRTIYGMGITSCGSWSAARKAKGNQQIWVEVKMSWLLGWISATSAYATVPPKVTDSEALGAWLDNYCSANPLKQLVDAAEALVVELGAKW